jgi:hypothetical protein
MNDIKKEMKDRARLSKGLVSALKYDVEYVYSDVKNYDLICLNESLRETKDTIQRLIDNISEIEYLAHVMSQHNT